MASASPGRASASSTSSSNAPTAKACVATPHEPPGESTFRAAAPLVAGGSQACVVSRGSGLAPVAAPVDCSDAARVDATHPRSASQRRASDTRAAVKTWKVPPAGLLCVSHSL